MNTRQKAPKIVILIYFAGNLHCHNENRLVSMVYILFFIHFQFVYRLVFSLILRVRTLLKKNGSQDEQESSGNL
jgi:hypothetical protein